MRHCVLAGLTLGLWAYILLGGLVFHLLESGHEYDTINDTLDAFNRLLENNTCLSHEELEYVLRTAYGAFREGIFLSDLDVSPSHKWEYPRAVFFCTTVVTTIGFGHLAPSTAAGRTFCVFYALAGIPFCLVVITALGRALTHMSERWCVRLSCCRGKKWVPLSIHILLGSVFFIWTASLVFSLVENWNYGEAVYFSFITLSTIGFGDFIAGGEAFSGLNRLPFQFLNTVWILGGLSWLSLIINSLQSSMEEKLSSSPDETQPATEKNDAHASQDRVTVRENQVAENHTYSGTDIRLEEL